MRWLARCSCGREVSGEGEATIADWLISVGWLPPFYCCLQHLEEDETRKREQSARRQKQKTLDGLHTFNDPAEEKT